MTTAALLRRKLGRDLVRSRVQVAATAVVVACAIGVSFMAASVRQSLTGSVNAYYEAYGFADIFGAGAFVPNDVLPVIARIPGVAAVEARIAGWVAVMPGDMIEPAVGRVLSLPVGRVPAVNRIALRSGRLPTGAPDEVVVLEPFAQAHGLVVGDGLPTRIGGQVRTLRIVGTALSPEAVFALAPGQYVPDARSFAVLWMADEELAFQLGFIDEFNDVAIRLTDPQAAAGVRAALDARLAPFGGTAAFERDQHPSHAFVEGQIDRLAGLAWLMPVLFMLVAVFLLYASLTRTIAVERRQIGVLRALGVGSRAVTWHYASYGVTVGALGAVLGAGLGGALGFELTRLYTTVFRLPAVSYQLDWLALALAAGTAVVIAAGTARMAVRQIVAAVPAAAMRPAPPPAYDNRLSGTGLGPRSRMLLRQLARHRTRGVVTALAMALTMALGVATIFSFDALEHIVDVTRRSEQQDATILVRTAVDASQIETVRALPGIERAEGFRSVTAELRHDARQVSAPLVGLPDDGILGVLLGPDLRRIRPPESGLALSLALADVLAVEPGDIVALTLPGAATFEVPVAALTEQYFGMQASVALGTLTDWLGDGPRITGVRVVVDRDAVSEMHASLAALPDLAGIISVDASLAAFRETMARTLTILVSFFVAFALLTAIGVAIGMARIHASERRQDVAILRALGYARREVATLLAIELLAPAIAAIPAGLLIGRLFGWFIVEALGSPQFRVPLVVSPSTDVIAVSLILTASLAAVLWVARGAVGEPPAAALASEE